MKNHGFWMFLVASVAEGMKWNESKNLEKTW
jgi:hypothetical protein